MGAIKKQADTVFSFAKAGRGTGRAKIGKRPAGKCGRTEAHPTDLNQVATGEACAEAFGVSIDGQHDARSCPDA